MPAWPLFDWASGGGGAGGVCWARVAYGLRAGNMPVGVFGGIGAFTALRQLRGYARAGTGPKTSGCSTTFRAFWRPTSRPCRRFRPPACKFIPFPYNFLWPTALGCPHHVVAPAGAGRELESELRVTLEFTAFVNS